MHNLYLLVILSCFLSFTQLLYVDSLDISRLNIVLPEGRFAVNIWSNEDIDTVLAADIQNDGCTYGKLEVINVIHPCYAVNSYVFSMGV